jgi:hypothetical protein
VPRTKYIIACSNTLLVESKKVAFEETNTYPSVRALFFVKSEAAAASFRSQSQAAKGYTTRKCATVYAIQLLTIRISIFNGITLQSCTV